MEVIQLSRTEEATSIAFAPRKDWFLRICVDHRKFNTHNVRNIYIIPSIDDFIASLGSALIFSKLDTSWSYWHVEIDYPDHMKTAFELHHGLFRFSILLVELDNAPGTSQRTMAVISLQTIRQLSLVLGEIFILPHIVDKHISYACTVQSLLQKSGVILILEKGNFVTEEIDYFGHTT